MIAWSLQDLVERFDVLGMGTSASIFDPEKLRWMNGRYIRGSATSSSANGCWPTSSGSASSTTAAA